MTSAPRARVVVLASGGGSNLGAILAHFEDLGGACRAAVVGVASDRPDAGALERARARGIPGVVLRTKARPEDEPLDAVLDQLAPDLVVLAGYLRLVPRAIVERFHGRMVNVHPALLPAFGGAGMYGMRVHQAVLESGARVTGPTVHFVDEHFDRGAVIAQWPVPVLDTDTPDALAARVLEVEHLLYPRAVHAVAAGDVALDGSGRTRWRQRTQATLRFALSDRLADGGTPLHLDLLYPNH